jgi:hypothetical protein
LQFFSGSESLNHNPRNISLRKLLRINLRKALEIMKLLFVHLWHFWRRFLKIVLYFKFFTLVVSPDEVWDTLVLALSIAASEKFVFSRGSTPQF